MQNTIAGLHLSCDLCCWVLLRQGKTSCETPRDRNQLCTMSSKNLKIKQALSSCIPVGMRLISKVRSIDSPRKISAFRRVCIRRLRAQLSVSNNFSGLHSGWRKCDRIQKQQQDSSPSQSRCKHGEKRHDYWRDVAAFCQ